jgi:hypothetical protein
MVFGFGLRSGAPAHVFAMFGAALFGAGAVAGGVAIVVLTLLCGIAYVALVARERQHWLAWAIAVGAAAAVVMFVSAQAGGGTIALVLTRGNLIEIGVVIALTLPIGMRFALPKV